MYRNVKSDFIKTTFGVDVDGLSVSESVKKLKEVNLKSYTEKSFFSTSAIKEANAFKFRKVHIEARAKNGTNAIVVNNYSERDRKSTRLNSSH